MPVPLLEQLKMILEHSHNAYMFRYRCKGQQIIIDKMPDNTIVAYYADDRSGLETIDITKPPFERMKYFSKYQ